MFIVVKVKVNSSKNELQQISDNSFEAKVTVPPEKGKANEAVINILAKHFKTAKSNIVLKTGKTAREKVFEIN